MIPKTSVMYATYDLVKEYLLKQQKDNEFLDADPSSSSLCNITIHSISGFIAGIPEAIIVTVTHYAKKSLLFITIIPYLNFNEQK